MMDLKNADKIQQVLHQHHGELPGIIVSIPGSHLRLWIEEWQNGNVRVVIFEPMTSWHQEVYRSIEKELLAHVLFELGKHQLVAGKTRKDVKLFIKSLNTAAP